ncbi:MAG: hypothetical protein ABFC94_01895, partial [Syntrophomonas sp.]
MITINKAILNTDYYKNTIARQFVEYIEKNINGIEDATLYYGYPVVRELDEEMISADITIVSPNHGLLIFKCDALTKIRDNEDDILNYQISRLEDIIFSRLIKSPHKNLKAGKRQLSFNFETCLYLPYLSKDISHDSFESTVIVDNSGIIKFFSERSNKKLDNEVITAIFSILDATTGIIRPKERIIPKDDICSKAYLLKKLEEEIALFDEQQKYAALSQLNGPQRIRGLAGSGKTIILCIKAAFLHLKYPDKKILYTFMTRSLYDYIQVLITRFYKLLGDGNLPDFEESIHIRHAWGGHNLPGVYFDTCLENSVEPINFNKAKLNSDRNDVFDYVCNQLIIERNGKLKKEYDYVLIDEGQDFKPRFYQICRAIVNDDCLVWAYDELQNIFNINLQDTVNTFKNEFGAQGINLAELQKNHPEIENDIVLSKCYRNPLEILVTAHSIGFGIYSDQLIQSLENNAHWQDLGYEVLSGNCQDGDEMVIKRPPKNSP